MRFKCRFERTKTKKGRQTWYLKPSPGSRYQDCRKRAQGVSVLSCYKVQSSINNRFQKAIRTSNGLQPVAWAWRKFARSVVITQSFTKSTLTQIWCNHAWPLWRSDLFPKAIFHINLLPFMQWRIRTDYLVQEGSQTPPCPALATST